MKSFVALSKRPYRPLAILRAASVWAVILVAALAPERCRAKDTVTWTPVKGDFELSFIAAYGTQGGVAVHNRPGRRSDAVSWTDASGNLWLFGGYGYDASGSFGYLNDLWKYDASMGYWTWVNGSNTVGQVGTYGTQGVADAANAPGGRKNATSWIDASGNLWLFGGYGYDASGSFGYLNDLWKYDASTGYWTWVNGSSTHNQTGAYGTQGVADAVNAPGGRYGAVPWTDASGNLWLFGGLGYDASGSLGYLNDLWKYNVSTGYWAWVKGSSTGNLFGSYGFQGTGESANAPGGRCDAVSWTDASGNRWLFGGQGYDGLGYLGYLDDLWKYDASTGNWTWVKGASTRNQSGTYGTQGVADASNMPGARQIAVSWIDASGKLWLFGGQGYDGSGNSGYLNDLWKYDASTGQWTWIKGSNAVAQYGTYGTQGVAAAANAPGGRSDAVAWTDASGKLWLFGGWGCDGASNSSRLNDLWKYEISTGYWTWVKGLKAIKQYGTYGTQGVAAATNAPGARQQATLWKDALGVPWLFGGQGYDGSGNAGYLGDLWKYDALTGNWTWAKGSSTSNQSGIYGTQGVADSANMPGGRQGAASWVDASVTSRTLWLFGGQGKDATGAQGCLNDLWNYDATTGNWTWVKGSSTSNQAGTYGTQGVADAANAPGARSAAVAWTDASGNLWLFGGQGYDGSGNVGDLSDLWKYDASAGNWTWVNGSNTVGQAGTYGTQGVADAANMPGGRQGAASWVDASVTSRTLWLFGGQGYDGSGNAGYLSDLWKYDVTTGNWTWVNGSSASNQAGAYGTQGIADAANAPGARDAAVSWKDASGNLWLFGGQGDDGSGNAGYLNDLWKYNPTRGYWTWVNGSNTSNQTGAYWTQGVAAAANAPGARSAPVSWIDASGKLWLFGGQGYDCGGAVVSYLNDLWSGEISTLSGAQEWRGYP